MESEKHHTEGIYERKRYFGDFERPCFYIVVILLFLLFFFTFNSIQSFKQETQKHTSPRYAWVTIVSGNPYSKGAMVLAHSLRKVKTKYELVCLSIQKENNQTKQRFDLLRKFFDRIVFIEPASPDWFTITEQFAINSLSIYFMKFRTLEFIEYDKICVIGSDYLVIKNIDSVFGCPAPCAVLDTFLWKMSSLFPIINGDMMVLKPSISDVKGLIELLPKINWTNAQHFFYDENFSWLGPEDQGLLAYYYGSRWTVLSYSIAGMEVSIVCPNRPYACDFSKLRAIHFATSTPRPWEVINATLTFAFEGAFHRESYQIYTEYMIDLMEGLSIEDRLIFSNLSIVHKGLVCPRATTCSKMNGGNFSLDSTPYDILSVRNIWKRHCDTIMWRQYFGRKRISICEAKVKFYQDKFNASGFKELAH